MLWCQLQGKCTFFGMLCHRICSFNENDNMNRSRGPRGLYGGVIPAVVGAVPSSDARYNSYSVDVNQPKEVPLNHDNTGTTNTAVSKGTILE